MLLVSRERKENIGEISFETYQMLLLLKKKKEETMGTIEHF